MAAVALGKALGLKLCLILCCSTSGHMKSLNHCTTITAPCIICLAKPFTCSHPIISHTLHCLCAVDFVLRAAVHGLKLLFFFIRHMHPFHTCNLSSQLMNFFSALWPFQQDVLRAAIQGLKLFFVDASQGGDLGSAPRRQRQKVCGRTLGVCVWRGEEFWWLGWCCCWRWLNIVMGNWGDRDVGDGTAGDGNVGDGAAGDGNGASRGGLGLNVLVMVLVGDGSEAFGWWGRW